MSCASIELDAEIEPSWRHPEAAMMHWALPPRSRQPGGPSSSAAGGCASKAERSGLRREGVRACVLPRTGDEGERISFLLKPRTVPETYRCFSHGKSSIYLLTACSPLPRSQGAGWPRGQPCITLVRKQVVRRAPKRAQNQFRECYNPIPTVLSIL
jgi:hypothetical protein